MIFYDEFDYLSPVEKKLITAKHERWGGNDYRIGQKVGSYTLIKKYKNFWLWEYTAPNGESYNECFFRGFNPCDIEIYDDEY